MSVHIATRWEEIAATVPDRPALVHGDVIRSWRTFDDRAARFATAMTEAGVREDDVVAIDLYNCSEYLEVWFAALKIGALPANINYRYGHGELTQLLRMLQPAVFVVHASLADRVRAALAGAAIRLTVVVDDTGGARPGGARPGSGRPGADYDALVRRHPPAERRAHGEAHGFLCLTGGTTGMPKAVTWSGVRMVDKADTLSRLLLRFPDDVWDLDGLDRVRRLDQDDRLPVGLPVAPLMHGVGLQMLAIPVLTCGGSVVTLRGRSLDPGEVFDAVAGRAVTVMSIVGDPFARPMVRHLRDAEPLDRLDGLDRLGSLESICSAGAAWSADARQDLARYLPAADLIELVGSSEGATIGYRRYPVAHEDPRERRFSPTPGLLLVDEDGREIPRDSRRVGMFVGPTPAVGYRGDPDATAAVFRRIDGASYVVVGDLGHWNADGSFTFVGRGDSIINSGGEKVSADEVEAALRALPDVEDCLVLGIPDRVLGERVAAVVQLRAGSAFAAATITSRLEGTLARYKLPRTVLVAAVPRGPNGKVRLAEVKAMLTAAGRDD